MNSNINNSYFFYKISNILLVLFLFFFSTHFAQQSPTITPLSKDTILPSVSAIPKDSLIPQNKTKPTDSLLPLVTKKITKPSLTSNKAITTTFVYSNIDYTEFSSISNVLKVINNKKEACTIKVKVSHSAAAAELETFIFKVQLHDPATASKVLIFIILEPY